MSYDSIKFRIKADPLYALSVFKDGPREHQFAANSKLLSIGIDSTHISNTRLKDFYMFNPSYDLCKSMLKKYGKSFRYDYAAKQAILACIVFKYDRLFFEHTYGFVDVQLYYEYAIKSGNQEVLDWVRRQRCWHCKKTECFARRFEKKETSFDYSLFINYT